jgi:hypothetical protein
MTFLLIPNGFRDPAENPLMQPTVWVGAIDEEMDGAGLTLDFEAGRQGLGQWQSWPADGPARIRYQRVALPGLAPRTTFNLRLLRGAQTLADAQITTLPDRLPVKGIDKAFTVFLGSCFCAARDPGCTVGSSFLRIPTESSPELKFLCGDQVYLDSPSSHYSIHRHSVEELQTELFENYKSTWTQGPRGFSDLLKQGANYFSSDDHEYWNNAPDKAPLVLDTFFPLFRNRREDWLRIARELYSVFQTPDLASSFRVGQLSFLNLDTRFDRQSDQSTFIKQANLTKLGRWVKGLTGPGVLVIGQPLLANRSRFLGLEGQLVDFGLPDFKQYADLINVLVASEHTIVILTGDVHFGRIANCTLASGIKLIEVISSPMALVDDRVGGRWGEPPKFFPSFDVPLAVGRKTQVEFDDKFKHTENQFVTLEFAAEGATVDMTVKAWPVKGGRPPFNPLSETSINLGIGANV